MTGSPRAHLYTVCWDEADMLGFFFRHYDPWVERYVIYDDGSSDGSLEILHAHPKVEVRSFERTVTGSFCLSHQAMQNEAWKESRGAADWVVVTAIDEHLHVRHKTMSDYLGEQARRGATLLPALGFDMNHPVLPDDRGRLVDRVTRGRPRPAFNKLSIFRPDEVLEAGFAPGRHKAEPEGDLRLPARDEVMLWHYKHLGFERNAARERDQGERLGTVDRAKGLAIHYSWSKDRLRAFWDEMEAESRDLSGCDFAPERACARPLWWEERANISRLAAPAPAAVVDRTPCVSVLIKSYNHAAYVGQTIRSVLDQDFADFEIVATDDASSDATADVIRQFDDPRIRLEVLPENVGISAAMNATIARARGRYLAILNSDDWALPGRLRRQVAWLDAHPQTAAVFGLPRTVNEAGEPAEPFNDFRVPLGFAAQTRQSWLRYFFFNRNCLCAPTAMVRREAYETVGPYDPRLTNLQDLDMWVRMLIAGFDLHLLDEEVTAFRIRDDNANMSAPRRDTTLRTAFELTQIFKRLCTLEATDLGNLFGADEPAASAGASIPARVAALALRVPRPEYQCLALQCLYDGAQTQDDHRRLASYSGVADPFGIAAAQDREAIVAPQPAAAPATVPLPSSLASARVLSDIVRGYWILLGRAPDVGGLLAHWELVGSGTISLQHFVGALLGSEEFRLRYGALDPATIVMRHAFDRAVTAAERDVPPEALALRCLRDPRVKARYPVIATLFPGGLPLAQRHLYTWWREERQLAAPTPEATSPLPLSLVVVARQAAGEDRAASLRALPAIRAQIVLACVDDDVSTIMAELESAAGEHGIVVVQGQTMSTALAAAQARCSRAFVGLMELGDELCEDAFDAVPLAEIDILIGDQDQRLADGLLGEAAFHGRFDPDVLLQQPPAALVLFRRALIEGLAWHDTEALDLAQWDMLLRASASCRVERIRTAGAVLVHRARRPAAPSRSRSAAMTEIGRRAVAMRHAEADGPAVLSCASHLRIRYPLKPHARATVIIPTRDRPDLLAVCLDGILSTLGDIDGEVVVVDNCSREPETAEFLAGTARHPRCRVMAFDEPFNWSRISNRAIAACAADVVVLLNNDTAVTDDHWLEELVAQAMRPEVGVVGAKLVYDDDRIQHAGIEIEPDSETPHIWRYASRWEPGYGNQLRLVRNVSAVTGACLAFRRSVWEEVGGFDEQFAVTWNDLDFCLRAREVGYRIIWTPHATLRHSEQATRGPDTTPQALARLAEERRLVQARWSHVLPSLRWQSPHLRADHAQPLLRSQPIPDRTA